MDPKTQRAAEIQREYYTETAAQYEQMHGYEGSGDPALRRIVHSLLKMVNARSVLDVGTATGRGLNELREATSNGFVCGVEPVRALIEEGARNGHIRATPIVCASGAALPFADASFDAVCEFAILHHVPDPNAVVKEMLRVAKKAVIISDSNRFGQGSRAARLIKLALYRTRLWGTYNFLRTGGKGYRFTEGDGLAYSYSVYDSFHLITKWADRVVFYSDVDPKVSGWNHPLLAAQGVLICGLRRFD